MPLPQAYRSLPRPSSPPCAQASPTCLHSLDYNNLLTQAERLQSLLPRPTRPFSGLHASQHAQCTPPIVSSVNHFLRNSDEMPPFNKDSQIRDSTTLPLSKSIDAHRRDTSKLGVATRRRKLEIEFGIRMYEASDYRNVFRCRMVLASYSNPLRR